MDSVLLLYANRWTKNVSSSLRSYHICYYLSRQILSIRLTLSIWKRCCKKFRTKKLKVPKYFKSKKYGWKKIWVQKLLVPKRFGLKKSQVKNIFGPKKIGPKHLGPKKFLVRQFWVKNFWVHYMFGTKDFKYQKILSPKNFWDQKIFRSKE